MVGLENFINQQRYQSLELWGVGWEKESCCHALREPGHTRISIGVYVPSQAVETRLNATLI